MTQTSMLRMLRPLALVVAVGLPAAARASPFGPAEQATFLVKYLGLPAGTVQVTVGSTTRFNDKDVWPIVLLARTESVFRIYPVKDRFVTFWDPAEQRTCGSDFFADEGGRKRRLKVDLFHERGKARIQRWFADAHGSDEEWDVEAGSYDMAAIAYALRLKPLAVGDEIYLPVFTGRHAFRLKARALAEETLAVPAGKFETVKLAIQTSFQGKLEATSDLRAWLTTDERHVPVRVDGSFLLGTLSAELTGYYRGLDGSRFGAK